MIDIIILSHARNQMLLELTQRTIDSCHASENDIKFNVLVLEQEPNTIYRDCLTGFTKGEFNYNAFMNLGISMTSNKYVCLCNNDLVFEKNWATNLIQAMKDNELLSACPTQKERMPLIEYGYNNNHHLNGWCIMCDRKLFDIIGEIDSEFAFWFADNIYSEQLKKQGVKHAVVNNSVVKHLGSTTLNGIEQSQRNKFTTDLVKRFIKRHPNNESAIFFASQPRFRD